jgi:hypothetical protein
MHEKYWLPYVKKAFQLHISTTETASRPRKPEMSDNGT